MFPHIYNILINATGHRPYVVPPRPQAPRTVTNNDGTVTVDFFMTPCPNKTKFTECGFVVRGLLHSSVNISDARALEIANRWLGGTTRFMITPTPPTPVAPQSTREPTPTLSQLAPTLDINAGSGIFHANNHEIGNWMEFQLDEAVDGTQPSARSSKTPPAARARAVSAMQSQPMQQRAPEYTDSPQMPNQTAGSRRERLQEAQPRDEDELAPDDDDDDRTPRLSRPRADAGVAAPARPLNPAARRVPRPTNFNMGTPAWTPVSQQTHSSQRDFPLYIAPAHSNMATPDAAHIYVFTLSFAPNDFAVQHFCAGGSKTTVGGTKYTIATVTGCVFPNMAVVSGMFTFEGVGGDVDRLAIEVRDDIRNQMLIATSGTSVCQQALVEQTNTTPNTTPNPTPTPTPAPSPKPKPKPKPKAKAQAQAQAEREEIFVASQ